MNCALKASALLGGSRDLVITESFQKSIIADDA